MGSVAPDWHAPTQQRRFSGTADLAQEGIVGNVRTGMIDLGSLAGDSGGAAVAINSKGNIAGWSFNCGIGASCPVQSFRWTFEQAIIGLGTLGGKSSNAVAINDTGEIIGVS